jgi:hypothetical protein
MKLVCIRNTELKFKLTSFQSSFEEKIDGLTLGKTYSVFALPITSGYHPIFLVFDDNKEWKQYEAEFFVPLEE